MEKETKKTENAAKKKSSDPASKKTGAKDAIVRIAELSGEVKALKEKVKNLEEEKKKLSEDMLLVRADAENYRKRADRDKEDSVAFANKKIIEDMLPNVDSIDVALTSIKDEGIKKGIELVRSTFMNSLKKWGLEEIEPLDKEFDPAECEACLFEEKKGLEFDTVVQVLQAGYKLNGKVIRPAKVKIAKKIGG